MYTSIVKPIYLDFAAATPVDQHVFDAMVPYFSDVFYNPSALYKGARDAASVLSGARSRVARSIGCRPSEIVFTAGGTESANLAICGVMNSYPGAEVIVSAVEHDAVRVPAQTYTMKTCPVDTCGMIDVNALRTLISDETVLVSVMYANNEVGTVQPLQDVVALVAQIRLDRKKRQVKLPLYIHTDACQAPLSLDCSVSRLGVDLMTLNGGKMYGPKQSGVLYVRAGVRLRPLIVGGGQEMGYRSGTENVAYAVGFATALEQAQTQHKEYARSVLDVAHYFTKRLEESYGVIVHGHKKKRLPNNVHVTFPGCDNERVLMSLDDQGVFAAAGSACSASRDEVSHVLSAMNVSEEDARSSVRFTLGKSTTKDEIDQTIDRLRIALKA